MYMDEKHKDTVLRGDCPLVLTKCNQLKKNCL